MGPPRASLKRWVPRSHGVACRGLRNRDGENDVISIPKGLPRAIRLPTASSSGPGGRNPLPNDLLPAVEAVSGGALLLFDRPLFLVRTAAGGQLPLEGVEDLGNAVVELNARESGSRSDASRHAARMDLRLACKWHARSDSASSDPESFNGPPG